MVVDFFSRRCSLTLDVSLELGFRASTSEFPFDDFKALFTWLRLRLPFFQGALLTGGFLSPVPTFSNQYVSLFRNSCWPSLLDFCRSFLNSADNPS